MGIPLPQYRGGAHYTWQILMENKMGCCNLQMVNEHTVQGVFDSGEIIKTEDYNFPDTVRSPNDYFEVAVAHEVKFVKAFLNEIREGKKFHPKRVQRFLSGIVFLFLTTVPSQNACNSKMYNENQTKIT